MLRHLSNLTTKMEKYLIFLILISNFCFGQSESRQTFVLTSSELENFEYNTNEQLTRKITKGENGITILNFYYENSLPKKIEKITGKKKFIFRYEYEYYK